MAMVSVPLRGYGFEISLRYSSRRACWSLVSVPLRGYGFEIMKDPIKVVAALVLFPSPYGDMVLKLFMNLNDKLKQSGFPSPYGDMVLKYFI